MRPPLLMEMTKNCPRPPQPHQQVCTAQARSSPGACVLEAPLIPLELGRCPAAALAALHPPGPPHPTLGASTPLCSEVTTDTSQGRGLLLQGLGCTAWRVSTTRRGHSPATNPEAAQPILVQAEMTQLPAELTTALLRIQVRTSLDFWKPMQPLPACPPDLIRKVRFKKHQFANWMGNGSKLALAHPEICLKLLLEVLVPGQG